MLCVKADSTGVLLTADFGVATTIGNMRAIERGQLCHAPGGLCEPVSSPFCDVL